MAQQLSDADKVAWRRIKKYNPFIVGLDQRETPRKFYLEFFDGESGSVLAPITAFDGHRAERDYPYFLPGLVLVVLSALLPIAILKSDPQTPWYAYAVASSLYVFGCAALVIFAMLKLIALRNEYSNANGKILVTNFIVRAQGIQSIVHMFKRVLRWRRFMRYAMSFGYVLLGVAIAFVLYESTRKHNWFPAGNTQIAAATLQFAISALALYVFEIGRKRYTRGVDPTLALVLMVEEIGGQLLAHQQTRLVTTSSEG
ncbi:MAG TPA: hypothetical protein VGF56_00450 [Rhizomicrobium sp.]|jgi:hypothetical protein